VLEKDHYLIKNTNKEK